MHTTLVELPDAAAVRLIAADPALDAEFAALLLTALAKLFAQFAREARLRAYALELAADGAVLVLAWAADAALSGCSHDKINHLLEQFGARSGRRFLDAPPLVVELDGRARAMDRGALRAAVAAGRFSADGFFYDLRAPDVGTWRRAGRRCVRGSWLEPLLALR